MLLSSDELSKYFTFRATVTKFKLLGENCSTRLQNQNFEPFHGKKNYQYSTCSFQFHCSKMCVRNETSKPSQSVDTCLIALTSFRRSKCVFDCLRAPQAGVLKGSKSERYCHFEECDQIPQNYTTFRRHLQLASCDIGPQYTSHIATYE